MSITICKKTDYDQVVMDSETDFFDTTWPTKKVSRCVLKIDCSPVFVEHQSFAVEGMWATICTIFARYLFLNYYSVARYMLTSNNPRNYIVLPQ